MSEEEIKPLNYLLCLSHGLSTSVVLIRCLQSELMNHARSLHFAYPQADLDIYALAGEKSVWVPGVHLKLIDKIPAKQYLQRVAMRIRAEWTGKEREFMSNDISLLLAMLRDQQARMTSRPQEGPKDLGSTKPE